MNNSKNNSRSTRSKKSQNNRSRQKRNQNRKKNKNGKPIRQISPVNFYSKLSLSECSRKYLQAQTNPFSPTLVNACVPDLYDIPSFKDKLTARGTTSIGTAGFGFVQLITGRTIVYDTSTIFYSDATFTGTASATTGTGVVPVSMLQAHFATANIGVDAIQGRRVGIGLRVRYLGTTLNQSGRVILYRPRPSGTTNGLTPSTVLSDMRAISLPTGRKWHCIAWQADTTADYQYIYTDPTSFQEDPDLLICFEGVPGSGYEFEVVAHLEYVGKTSNLTPSESDIQGMSCVRSAINSVDTILPANESVYSSLYKQIINFGSSTMTSPVLTTAAASAATKILNRGVESLI